MLHSRPTELEIAGEASEVTGLPNQAAPIDVFHTLQAPLLNLCLRYRGSITRIRSFPYSLGGAGGLLTGARPRQKEER